MKLAILAIFALLAVSIQLASAFPSSFDDFFENEDLANEFLRREEEGVDKRFLYTGKEQRREVQEKYEEKCERKLISSAMHKPRWCPELNTWPAWNEASKTDPKTTKKPSIIKKISG
jgi:hypothetical protein